MEISSWEIIYAWGFLYPRLTGGYPWWSRDIVGQPWVENMERRLRPDRFSAMRCTKGCTGTRVCSETHISINLQVSFCDIGKMMTKIRDSDFEHSSWKQPQRKSVTTTIGSSWKLLAMDWCPECSECSKCSKYVWCVGAGWAGAGWASKSSGQVLKVAGSAVRSMITR